MNGRIEVTRKGFLDGMMAGACAGCLSPARNERPVVRFGFVTDCHYAADLEPRPGDLRRYRQGVDRMRAFVREMNEAGVDFVIEGGDFKDLGRTPERSLGYLDEIEAAFAGFNGPRYHVLGNHDHDNLSKEEFLAHVANEGQMTARAFYAFTCNGVKFIVLDACYRPDGTPYCRGRFSWKETLIPDEQVEFLRAELASATGPCVPIVHQQLDAEDETCIRNASAVRAVIEASGKVTCVVQGHYHEGSFREINGVGYYSLRANVIGDDPDGSAHAVVAVAADGSVSIEGRAAAVSARMRPEGGWENPVGWRPGHYQIHFIYTGRGESMLHIFPDGTSMLVDCGDSMRFHDTPAETPLLPDLSRRAGEWVARYVTRVNPKGAAVDYFHLSHYHEDHGGGERYHGGRIETPDGGYWRCGLADAARFLRFDRVVDRAWPTFDDPQDALGASRDGTSRNMRAVYADLQRKGARLERFALGSRVQFRQLDAACAKDGFEVVNICANGRIQAPGAAEPRNLYPHLAKGKAKWVNENGMSCGMIIRYGKFRFFTAGDFSDRLKAADGSHFFTENALGEIVGRVDVAKANHHGHHAMHPGLVRALQARVWTACVLDRQHMTDDTCTRLADRSLYCGDRTILPEYMPLNRPETPVGRAYLADVPQVVRDAPCHLVFDVPEGGATYTVSCLSPSDESLRLKAVFGYFSHSK